MRIDSEPETAAMNRHPSMGRWWCVAGAVWLAASATFAQDAPKPEKTLWPGIQPSGGVLLPNGWSLRPAGRQTLVGDFPVLIAENPARPVLAILHAGYGEHEVMTVGVKDSKRIARVSIPESYGGLAWSSDGARLFVGGGFDDCVYRFRHEDGLLSERTTFLLAPADAGALKPGDEPLVRAERGSRRPAGAIAGLALSKDDKTLWVANAFAQRLEKLDAETGRLLAEVVLEADSFPFALVVDEARGRLYASLWGKERIAVVDTKSDRLLGAWPTGPHPNEMVLGRDGKTLFVANANLNTVTVHDLDGEGKAAATIGTAIDPNAPAGCTPNALALSPDGSLLLVANANTNDVAAFNVKDPAHATPLGFIPTGWYPTSVRISRDGKSIWVANGKGTTSLANRDGPNPFAPRAAGGIRQYIGGLMQGTLSTVAMPTPARMGAYSRAVYECSPVRRGDPSAVRDADRFAGNPIPTRAGEASPIKYCVFIIKENRTYDQVFGDIAAGNGDDTLCLFPEEVTPNHHALAQEYVLLDNFYVESEVSADGHEWTMGAYATDFVERTWPLSYRGDSRVPYPSEGAFAIAKPAGGYLWDRAKATGISYRSYGEFVSDGKTTEPALVDHFHPTYPSYNLAIRDVDRAGVFLSELKEFEAEGAMPQLCILRLPNDHTSGTRPGSPTPIAMVADNDLALGTIVAGLSKSRFWREMAIFVVEDDAQNGSDHVDAHRTVALVVGPYCKRKYVDSTMYTTSSMLRSMELILGLEPMSQFDASARPMFASFQAEPDASPYSLRPARVDLDAVNAEDAPGATLSMQLDLSKEDQADDLIFNEIIWRAVKGANSIMPPPVRAAFVLPQPERDDDDD